MHNEPQLQPSKKAQGQIDTVPWNILMQILETIPGFSISLRNVRGTYMKEDPIRLVLEIFSFLKREREREKKKITTIIFTSSSVEVLLHLIQTCSHGDPHRTFKVNPIAARRCLGVRVCSSVCDCEQSEQRAGDDVCVCARARGARARGGRGAAHSRAPRPLRRGGGGGRTRRKRRRRRRRRRKWLSAAGRIKSNQTRPENCVQEGSDRRRMGKGEQLTAFETSRHHFQIKT
uniref:uncharacterized protein LOC106998842 n=1 Tax=Macaca mulatta TaxID=9544 RepID=UPI0010A29067|nr:uncharacterized protein LOC106998842 [Macaca mulatta]